MTYIILLNTNVSRMFDTSLDNGNISVFCCWA